jgi:hypothetical protein
MLSFPAFEHLGVQTEEGKQTLLVAIAVAAQGLENVVRPVGLVLDCLSGCHISEIHAQLAVGDAAIPVFVEKLY